MRRAIEAMANMLTIRKKANFPPMFTLQPRKSLLNGKSFNSARWASPTCLKEPEIAARKESEGNGVSGLFVFFPVPKVKDHTFDFTKLCRPSLLTAALRPSLEVELLLFLVVVKTPTPEMEFVGEDPCSIMLLHREERREAKKKSFGARCCCVVAVLLKTDVALYIGISKAKAWKPEKEERGCKNAKKFA
nr:hypothetical protein Iba_chr13dCG7440 [Ipomoea batatas]